MIASRPLAMITALALTAPACSRAFERRVTRPEADYDDGVVEAKVEERRGRRRGTWKPYLAASIVGVVIGATAMMWVGIVTPDRPLTVAGIVLVSTFPVVGSIPFIVKQDTPWVRTKWTEWQPAPNVPADVEIYGRADRPLTSTRLSSADDGSFTIRLEQTMCRKTQWIELGMVDLVIDIRDAEPRVLPMPVDRLGPKLSCTLSLMPNKEEEHAARDDAPETPM